MEVAIAVPTARAARPTAAPRSTPSCGPVQLAIVRATFAVEAWICWSACCVAAAERAVLSAAAAIRRSASNATTTTVIVIIASSQAATSDQSSKLDIAGAGTAAWSIPPTLSPRAFPINRATTNANQSALRAS